MDSQTLGCVLFAVGVIVAAVGFLAVGLRPHIPPTVGGQPGVETRSGAGSRSESQQWHLGRLL
jgi:hypothetical protein